MSQQKKTPIERGTLAHSGFLRVVRFAPGYLEEAQRPELDTSRITKLLRSLPEGSYMVLHNALPVDKGVLVLFERRNPPLDDALLIEPASAAGQSGPSPTPRPAPPRPAAAPPPASPARFLSPAGD